ncbi:MAG TPA: hypothetical protein VF054_18440 [Micromonosporaceae bacterium]
MAERGWGGSIATAVGVAGGAGAAQLGLGYGLGIVVWPRTTGAAAESTWLASLAWTTWIAASAAVIGAIVADRLSVGTTGTPILAARERLSGRVATSAWRLTLALAAVIGALITVPLVTMPARDVVRPETYAPELIAAGYAILGVIVGLGVAIASLAARAIAANVLATTAWLWVLAVIAVIDSVASGGAPGTTRLSAWRFTHGGWVRETLYVPGALLMLVAAFAIGALAAWRAARRDDNRVGVAISGAVGPFLVAAAYFLAAPKLTGALPDEQLSAYLMAPYAVMTGLAGSVLMVTRSAQPGRSSAARPEPEPDDEPSGAEPPRAPVVPQPADGAEADAAARAMAEVEEVLGRPDEPPGDEPPPSNVPKPRTGRARTRTR